MDQQSEFYRKYMNSDEWWAKRAERLRLDDNTCVMCGRPSHRTRGGLQVHHITYRRLGREDIADLVSLCPPCHTKIHNYYKRLRTWADKEARETALDR